MARVEDAEYVYAEYAYAEYAYADYAYTYGTHRPGDRGQKWTAIRRRGRCIA
jgi:hypothetical protein